MKSAFDPDTSGDSISRELRRFGRLDTFESQFELLTWNSTVLSAGCWKSAALLAGSCVEAVLLDLFWSHPKITTEKWGERWPRRVSALDMRHHAFKLGWISDEHIELGALHRRWRDHIHPAAAVEGRRPTEELAKALLASLNLLIADLAVSRAV